MRFVKIVCLLFIALACNPDRTRSEAKLFGEELGKIDKRLSEASGLVASIANPGFFWTLNDSGNPAEIFLIDQQAKIRLVVTLANVRNRDWEDINIDAGFDGKNYLFVADIGDNFLQYDNKLIYRFEEPVLTSQTEVYVTQFDTAIFRIPEGICNAETILIEPLSHDVFVVSKVKGPSTVYRLPSPLRADTMDAEKIAVISLWEIVGGDISADGQQVLLKSYNSIYYWKNRGGESLQQLLSRSPVEIPYVPEPQGEAVAWSRNGKEFYTLSESPYGRRANLIRWKMDKHN